MRYLSTLIRPCVRRQSAVRRSWATVRNLLLTTLGLALPLNLHAQTVSFAGLQTTLTAIHFEPLAIALDLSGNSYAINLNGNIITEISAAGVQSSISVSPALTSPRAIAVDSTGNLYVADHADTYIVKIPAGGGTAIHVGSGLSGPKGVAIDGSNDVFVADTGNARIVKVVGTTQTVVAVPAGTFVAPVAIAVDSTGNLYVADHADTYIVKIPAGGGTAIHVGSGLSGPKGVAIDGSNDVFVADTGNARIVKVVGTTQTVVAVPAGTFVTPVAIAVDPYGNLYVSDTGTQSLIEVKFSGSTVTVATVLSNLTNAPTYVAVDTSSDVYLSGGSDGQVTMYQVPAQLGAGGTIRQLGSALSTPEGLAIGSAGNVYVAEEMGSAIAIIAPNTPDLGEVNLCPSSGTQVAPCTSAATLTFDIASGENLSSVSAQAVTGGTPSLDFSVAVDSCLNTLTGPTTCTVTVQFKPLVPGVRLGAINISGIVGSATSPTLLATVPLQGLGVGSLPGFDAGVISSIPLTLQSGPFLASVIADNSGNLYFVDNNSCVIEKFSAPSGPTTIIAGTGTCGDASGDNGPATSAVFKEPWRLALSPSGDLYVSDDTAGVIRKIDGQSGIITTVAGTPNVNGHSDDETVATSAQLTRPFGLAFDAAGDLYFSDWAEHTVRKIDALSGVLTTVAGKYTLGCGSSGDGGSATAATLNNPLAIAIDANNALYIADANSHLVRKVDPSTGNISTVAGIIADAPSCTAPAVGSYSGDGGPATSANLNGPEGLAVDPANNVYIADSANDVVRKLNAATGIITTVAGVYSGSAQNSGIGGAANLAGLGYVQDVAIDSSGNFYLVDGTVNLVREVAQTSGVVNFATYNLGTMSPAIDVALTNNGNAPLDLSALTSPTNFNSLGADTTCTNSTTLTAGQGCILGVEFQPTVAGALTGSLTVTDDAGSLPGATQALALSGTGAYVPTQVAFPALPTTLTTGGNLGVVQASIESSGGNLVTNSSASVTATLTGPGAYSQTVTAAAVNGVASLDLSSVALSPAGSYVLTASSSGLTSATSMINVVNPPATQLVLGTLPSTIVASNMTGPVTVSVEAANGSTVTTSSTASVTLTITGPGSFSQVQTTAAVSGVATFTFSSSTLTTPGTYTLTATSTGLTSSSETVTVLAPPPTQVILSAVPASISAGGNLGTATATIETATGSVVTTSSAPVTLTISGTSYTQTVAAVNGVATFNLVPDPLSATGSYTVTATSAGLTPAIALVTVVAPPATQLALSGVPSTLVTGGSLGTATVKIEAANGSIVTTTSASVTLSITGPGSYAHTSTLAANSGVATFNLSSLVLTTPGTYTVSASSTGLTAATSTVSVTAPPATQLAVHGLPATISAGSNLGTVTATLEDASGSVVTSSAASVTATITGPGAVLQPVTASAVSGVATLDLSSLPLDTAGTYTVVISSGSVRATATVAVTLVLAPTGSSASTIAPGAAATFSISLAATNATYSQPVTLTASGLPAGATATFAPATLTPGPAAVTSTLTIQTTSTAAALHDLRGIVNGWGGLAMGMLLLPLAASRRFRKAASQFPALAVFFGLLSIGAVCGLAGCGGGGSQASPPPPAQQSYTITVTGTTGNAIGSTTVTLVVQ